MLHVAVLKQPYVTMLLQGEKSIECRLTRTQRPPFGAIEPGERILFKQSSGPYRAAALVDHVLFERDLTPRRVREIQRDYNDRIRGEESYWAVKTNARYCSLIWLREIEPIDRGPTLSRLQGRAWITLPDSTAALPDDPPDALIEDAPRLAHAQTTGSIAAVDGSFAITLTAGNLRNGTLYVTGLLDRFPRDAWGGATRAEAGRPVTLLLNRGPAVETDVVAARQLLRTRIWRSWYAALEARPGDRVVFTPAGERIFTVTLVHE